MSIRLSCLLNNNFKLTITSLLNNMYQITVYIQLKKFSQRFVVNADIDDVWKFYTDLDHLKKITPENMNIRIKNSTTSQIVEGQEAILEAKIIFLKKTWNTKITYQKPYKYIDEMIKGPFKKWRHIHIFEQIEPGKTNVIDEIDFELPYGILGQLLEPVAYKKLVKVFEYRKIQTTKILNHQNRYSGYIVLRLN